jgi:hypothetical protein
MEARAGQLEVNWRFANGQLGVPYVACRPLRHRLSVSAMQPFSDYALNKPEDLLPSNLSSQTRVDMCGINSSIDIQQQKETPCAA